MKLVKGNTYVLRDKPNGIKGKYLYLGAVRGAGRRIHYLFALRDTPSVRISYTDISIRDCKISEAE